MLLLPISFHDVILSEPDFRQCLIVTDYMSPPTSRVERHIDQYLIHFHNGIVSELGLNGEKMNLDRVRKIFRQENGLAKYVAFRLRPHEKNTK